MPLTLLNPARELPPQAEIVPVAKPPSWLVGDWRFFEGAGSKLHDLSRYRQHGSLVGATWTAMTHKSGYLNFDGIDDRVDFSARLKYNFLNEVTVFALAKPATGISTLARMFSTGSPTKFVTDELSIAFYIGGQWKAGTDINLLVTLDAWQSVAYTYNSTTKKIITYLNGTARGTVTLSGLSTYSMATGYSTFDIGIHENHVSRPWKGGIGYLRFFSKTLSASHVLALHNATAGMFA